MTTTAEVAVAVTIERWAIVDADDRYGGQYQAHVARATIAGHDFYVRITPGNHDTYRAAGFHVEIEDHGSGLGRHYRTFHADAVEEAKRRLPAELEHDYADMVAAMVSATVAEHPVPLSRAEVMA